ncbi:MAG: sigma-70 family RNA polymerase sigma factor [Planctomycetota bacterium]
MGYGRSKDLARPRLGDAECSVLYPEVLAMVEKEIAPALRSRLDASDIVQTTFREMLVLALAKNFRDARHLRRVLIGKARRHVLSLGRYHRAKKRSLDKEVSLSELEREDGDQLHPVDHSPSPAETAMQQELLLHLNEALGQLPASEREVLELLLERLEYPEIARRLSRSTETVRRTYWRAVEHLRERLRVLRDDAPVRPPGQLVANGSPNNPLSRAGELEAVHDPHADEELQ